MNILILAAGYATRLYPLTQTKAKPLLDVAGKPMMEWVIDNLAPIEGIEKVYVVTNHKFAADFQAWAEHYNQTHARLAFEIIDDGSTSDADKLGAIGDINLCIARAGLASSDLIVVAGDNLFSESLRDFGRFCSEKKQPVLAVHDEGSLEEAKKYGVVSVNAAGNNPDQPGRFVQWLYPRTPVLTWKVPGTWFDVGSKETFEEANRIFAQF